MTKSFHVSLEDRGLGSGYRYDISLDSQSIEILDFFCKLAAIFMSIFYRFFNKCDRIKFHKMELLLKEKHTAEAWI